LLQGQRVGRFLRLHAKDQINHIQADQHFFFAAADEEGIEAALSPAEIDSLRSR